nr:MAG TPA: hypothetical protein [Caudoviricetes sp.]
MLWIASSAIADNLIIAMGKEKVNYIFEVITSVIFACRIPTRGLGN